MFAPGAVHAELVAGLLLGGDGPYRAPQQVPDGLGFVESASLGVLTQCGVKIGLDADDQRGHTFSVPQGSADERVLEFDR